MGAVEFLEACGKVMGRDRERSGIGTLGEKTLHAVLKHYFEPDASCHEIKTDNYVADIRNDHGFFEIQTRGFYTLKGKLSAYLDIAPVTVIYPVPAEKRVIWIEEDGSLSKPHQSPKHAGPWEMLPELYALKEFLSNKDLHFSAVLLELEEYRLKDGWGNGGKRGSTRYERLPVSLISEVWINGREDYYKLIPSFLSEKFTVSEFAKAAKLSPRKAWQAVNVLAYMGAVKRAGQRGRSYLYERTE